MGALFDWLATYGPYLSVISLICLLGAAVWARNLSAMQCNALLVLIHIGIGCAVIFAPLALSQVDRTGVDGNQAPSRTYGLSNLKISLEAIEFNRHQSNGFILDIGGSAEDPSTMIGVQSSTKPFYELRWQQDGKGLQLRPMRSDQLHSQNQRWLAVTSSGIIGSTRFGTKEEITLQRGASCTQIQFDGAFITDTDGRRLHSQALRQSATSGKTAPRPVYLQRFPVLDGVAPPCQLQAHFYQIERREGKTSLVVLSAADAAGGGALPVAMPQAPGACSAKEPLQVYRLDAFDSLDEVARALGIPVAALSEKDEPGMSSSLSGLWRHLSGQWQTDMPDLDSRLLRPARNLTVRLCNDGGTGSATGRALIGFRDPPSYRFNNGFIDYRLKPSEVIDGRQATRFFLRGEAAAEYGFGFAGIGNALAERACGSLVLERDQGQWGPARASFHPVDAPATGVFDGTLSRTGQCAARDERPAVQFVYQLADRRSLFLGSAGLWWLPLIALSGLLISLAFSVFAIVPALFTESASGLRRAGLATLGFLHFSTLFGLLIVLQSNFWGRVETGEAAQAVMSTVLVPLLVLAALAGRTTEGDDAAKGRSNRAVVFLLALLCACALAAVIHLMAGAQRQPLDGYVKLNGVLLLFWSGFVLFMIRLPAIRRLTNGSARTRASTSLLDRFRSLPQWCMTRVKDLIVRSADKAPPLIAPLMLFVGLLAFRALLVGFDAEESFSLFGLRVSHTIWFVPLLTLGWAMTMVRLWGTAPAEPAITNAGRPEGCLAQSASPGNFILVVAGLVATAAPIVVARDFGAAIYLVAILAALSIFPLEIGRTAPRWAGVLLWLALLLAAFSLWWIPGLQMLAVAIGVLLLLFGPFGPAGWAGALIRNSGRLGVAGLCIIATLASWAEVRNTTNEGAVATQNSGSVQSELLSFLTNLKLPDDLRRVEIRYEGLILPERASAVGDVRTEEQLNAFAELRYYNSSPLFGRGYFDAAVAPGGLGRYELNDNLSAIHIIGPFGRAFAYLWLLAAILFGYVWLVWLSRELNVADVPVTRSSVFGWVVGAAAASSISILGAYMIMANLQLAIFTGRNVPFLAVTSGSDFVESCLLILMAFFGMILVCRDNPSSRGSA